MGAASAPRVLITGATGFLGSRLVWSLWRCGAEMWLLNRSKSPPAPRAHLAMLAGIFGGSSILDTPPPAWVPGNLWLPRVGVSPEWIERHRGRFDALIHLAADTRLRPVREEDQTRTNVEGTEAVAELAEALAVNRFHHVSTASVVGTAQGEIAEDDAEFGQAFRTHSEWTKFEAERVLRRRAAAGRLHLTVHRPAILVGDSVTGGAATFPHFYQLLSVWRQFAERADASDRVVLPLSPDATMHLIPVDHVAEGIVAALGDDSTEGQTLHWTPPEGATIGFLNDALARILRTSPIVFDPEASWPATGRDGAAKPLWDWVTSRRAYLSGGVRFLRSNADALCERHGLEVPQITAELLARLHRHWAWATRRG